MKSILRNGAAWALLLVLLVGLPMLVMAQPPPPLLPTPEQAPIDGGLSLLALAGGAYAYSKFRKGPKTL